MDQVASAMVEIRLLGPVEFMVRSDPGEYRPVSLGGARQRALFGLLALRAPTVVSVSALIDGIWGESPPPTAVKTLHAHVAYLRRALGAVGQRGLIETRPPGYALMIDVNHIDIHRFEAMGRRGSAAHAAGFADEAAELLGAALRLWRGDVLADCPVGEWARAEATRMEEIRLNVAEDLFTVEIGRGRHAAVTADLEAMVTRHPLRERLWELLMIAQYRGGRQGAALRAYRRARKTLVAELGIEPGRTLRGLEASILRGDDGQLAAAMAAVLAGPGRPTSTRERPEAARPTTDRPGSLQPEAVRAVSAGSGPGEARAALPAPITTLIGRQREIAEVARLLADRRLITLTGLGGSGKTRLAIAVASHLAPRYVDGVRFVDLTAVAEPESLPTTVANALGVPQRADLTPIDALLRHLGTMDALVVLDNCEHLVDAVATLLESLLRHCPDLRALTTSREALGVLGEVAWPVLPLSVPPGPGQEHQRGGLIGLSGYDSVRLFLDRAAVSAVRELTDADAPALAAICAGLDGLPLAIELAAARTTVLTVPEIADRIHDPALLRDRRPGLRAHHHALQSTMAWSYGLLGPAARSRFRRLAVFSGGFTLAAARAIWPDDDASAVDILASLVAKSLVVMDRRAAGARYRLLATLRQYAAERLAAHPQEASTAWRDHAAHYRALGEELDRNLHGPDLEQSLDRFAVEHDNLRAALAWYAVHRPGLDELRFAAALARYCHLRGRYDAGRRWLRDALSRYDGPAAPELAGALTGAARLAFFACDYAGATGYGERALAAYRELADRAGTARSLRLLGSIARERGHYDQSTRWYAEAVAAYRGTDDEAGVALTLQMSGFTNWLIGDLDRAEELLGYALRRYHLLADPEGIASASVHLAAVAHYRGESARARWLADDALARFRQLGFDEGTAWALNVIGLVAHHDGARGSAVEALRGSLKIHCAVGDRWRAASVLEALAAVLAEGSDPSTAAELIGAAATIRAAIGTPVPPQERSAWDGTTAALRRALSDRDRYAGQARGAALRLGDLPARLAGVAVPNDPPPRGEGPLTGNPEPLTRGPGPLILPTDALIKMRSA